MTPRPHLDRPVPLIDPPKCSGCGLCVAVCPNGVLSMQGDCAYVARPDRCEYVGDCERICPTRAIDRPFQIVLLPLEEEAKMVQSPKFHWTEGVAFGTGGADPQSLLENEDLKMVLVGLEPNQRIPPHRVPAAVYYFIEGSGWITVNGDRFEVEAGLIVRTPEGAQRSLEATTRLIFLGAHAKPNGHVSSDQ